MSEQENKSGGGILSAIVIIVFIVGSIVSMGAEQVAEVGTFFLILVAIAIVWFIISKFSDNNQKQIIVEDKPKVEKYSKPKEEEKNSDSKEFATGAVVLLGILILFGVIAACLTSNTTVNTGVGYVS
jgi:nitric oxide reductase large subunit